MYMKSWPGIALRVQNIYHISYATLCSCSATCICYKGDSWICRESNTATDSSMEPVYMVWARPHMCNW